MSQVAIFGDFDTCKKCPCITDAGIACKLHKRAFSESTVIQIKNGGKCRPSWCTLRPLPSYKMDWNSDEQGYETGWNDALDSIGACD